MSKFNFNDTTCSILDNWNVTEDDLDILCFAGFRRLVCDYLRVYRAINLKENYAEVGKLGVEESPYAWVYRTILAASYEVPHIRLLCAPQADGTSFISKLRRINAETEQQFLQTLSDMVGPAATYVRRLMGEPNFFLRYKPLREYRGLRRTLGCEDNFAQLANVACTANPRTDFGSDRHLLDTQMYVLHQIEVRYSLGALECGDNANEVLANYGIFDATVSGVTACQELRCKLEQDFHKTYLNNGVLSMGIGTQSDQRYTDVWQLQLA